MKDKYYHDTRGYYCDKYPEDEQVRLEKAVDKFAYKMKKRLIEKFEEGYIGWDDEKIKEKIKYGLRKDVHMVMAYGESKQDYIDIANRAMMLARFCNEE